MQTSKRVVLKAQTASVVPYGLVFFCSVRGKKEIANVLKQFLQFLSKIHSLCDLVSCFIAGFRVPARNKRPRECKLMFHSPLLLLVSIINVKKFCRKLRLETAYVQLFFPIVHLSSAWLVSENAQKRTTKSSLTRTLTHKLLICC